MAHKSPAKPLPLSISLPIAFDTASVSLSAFATGSLFSLASMHSILASPSLRCISSVSALAIRPSLSLAHSSSLPFSSKNLMPSALAKPMPPSPMLWSCTSITMLFSPSSSARLSSSPTPEDVAGSFCPVCFTISASNAQAVSITAVFPLSTP